MTNDELRQWRTTKNLTDPRWSQEFAAGWLGVSLRQYRRWEAGSLNDHGKPTKVPLSITYRIIDDIYAESTIRALRAQLYALGAVPTA